MRRLENGFFLYYLARFLSTLIMLTQPLPLVLVLGRQKNGWKKISSLRTVHMMNDTLDESRNGENKEPVD